MDAKWQTAPSGYVGTGFKKPVAEPVCSKFEAARLQMELAEARASGRFEAVAQVHTTITRSVGGVQLGVLTVVARGLAGP
jgi:hypothetical protein